MDGISPSDYGAYRKSSEECKDDYTFELEEVKNCSYYEKFGGLKEGLEIEVVSEVQESRYVVKDLEHGLVVGLVPVIYNSLSRCFEKGYTYSGKVTHVNEESFISVLVKVFKE